MPDDWDDHAEVVAAGSSCRATECGESALAYGPPDRSRRDHAEPREFTCPRWESTLPSMNLLRLNLLALNLLSVNLPSLKAVPEKGCASFRACPGSWLLPRVQAA